ncbi:hypothetical protein FB451DRAFT_1567861 [Mycena latifolia]|nr:hypothetical protein FB451DRAFT_1567861 [Mycena latifolia]
MEIGEELKKIDDLWFSNDTVILRAENTIFRVTKSILAARSPVFQAMFALPQPTSNGDQIMDGSPVVRLQDSAADVESFLRAIFDSSNFMPAPAEVDFHEVLGILRLSHKYDVDYLRKRALLHLASIYHLEINQCQDRTLYDNLNYDDDIVGLALTAIPVLHKVGATWLLPWVYYNVGTFDIEEVISAGEAWDTLPADMQRTCLLMHGHRIGATKRIYQSLSHPSTCPSFESCNSFKFGFLRRCLNKYGPDGLIEFDPLNKWPESSSYGWKAWKEELCHACFTQGHANYESVFAEIWDELPANCGLEDWATLKEMRRVALK